MDLYHVLNRGVDRRNIFLDTQDYLRYVQNLYEFNDEQRIVNRGRLSDLGGHSAENRTTLVSLHGWCLMRNHFHLLLSEELPGGISKFVMKVNVGYAKYFNLKYKRVGTLFQSKSKQIPIERDGHYMHILPYIHLNPLDYTKEYRGWRSDGVQDISAALEHLRNYRWSSYQDYCGVRNFPEILTRHEFAQPDYAQALREYLNYGHAAWQDTALEL